MRLTPQHGWKAFFKDLKTEIKEDRVSNGAAALAYYLTLSIFPALIVALTLVPYLPIQNVDQAIMDFVRQGLPPQASDMVAGIVQQVTSQRRGGLLSFGIVATIWAASNGFHAIMQQMNITYGVKEERSFIKARATALLMMLLFGVLIFGAFALVVFGGQLQGWIASNMGWSQVLIGIFAALRWVILLGMMLLGFAVIYYFAPNVDQKFMWISPGSLFGTVVLALASLAFSFYVSNFGNYSATYGSIGGVIILMFWMYITGWVLSLGAEINSLNQSYEGKSPQKAQKLRRQRSLRPAQQT